MNISPEQLAVFGTLAAAFLGLLATVASTWVARRSDERKHLRELVMKAAVENWKQQYEVYLSRNMAASIPPLDVYIVHMLKLSEILSAADITPAGVESKLREVDELTAAVMRYKRRQEAEKKSAGL